MRKVARLENAEHYIPRMVVDEYKVSLLIRKFRVVELVPPGEIPVHLALLDDSPHHFIPIRDSPFLGALYRRDLNHSGLEGGPVPLFPGLSSKG